MRNTTTRKADDMSENQGAEGVAAVAAAAANNKKRGRGPTVARWSIVTGSMNEPIIGDDRHTSDTAALRAIETKKIENAIGLFRPLAVESKVTARLV